MPTNRQPKLARTVPGASVHKVDAEITQGRISAPQLPAQAPPRE